VSRADLVKLPVHSGRVSVVNLHPVDADVAGPGLGITRVHICERDETSAVFRPTFDDREIFQGKAFSAFDAMDDFLTWRIAYGFWARMQEMNSLFEQVPAFAQISRRFCFQNELNFAGNIFYVCNLKRECHSAARSHRVDCNGEF
jgi:hypothetical protein